MLFSRRKFALLLPAAAAAQQTGSATLPSTVYHSSKIPYIGDAKKKGRQFFRGAEHSGFGLESHETILGPGTQTHAPHKHEHEEIITLVEGTVETYIDGKTEIAEAGSVIFLASNQMHSVRNAGSTPCRYYVIELRGRQG
jgi:XRE family transcriptional regulator, regulator of sulfur utilization